MREATPSFTLVKVVAVGILPVPHQNPEKKPGIEGNEVPKMSSTFETSKRSFIFWGAIIMIGWGCDLPIFLCFKDLEYFIRHNSLPKFLDFLFFKN